MGHIRPLGLLFDIRVLGVWPLGWEGGKLESPFLCSNLLAEVGGHRVFQYFLLSDV